MVEVASGADVAWNDELWIGPIGTPAGGAVVTAWTQVLGVEELNMPEKTPDDIDVTHMQSPGRTRETIPGLLSVADWSQDIQLWAGDDVQTDLDALAALTEAGTPEMIRVEFNVGGLRRTYRGYVNTFIPQGSVGDKRMVTLSAKLFERVTPNPRTP
jgi:hypothetical protein